MIQTKTAKGSGVSCMCLCLMLHLGFIHGGCTDIDIVGARAETDGIDEDSSSYAAGSDSDTEDSDTEDSSGDSATVREGAQLPLPFTLDFDTDDNQVNNFGHTEWNWNAESGTYDVDVTFNKSSAFIGFDYFLSEDISPWGVDLSDAGQISYTVKTVQADAGSGMLYIQSIENETPANEDEQWLWHSQFVELQPGAGWITYRLPLQETDTETLNLTKVTKFGFQVHAPYSANVSADSEQNGILQPSVRIALQIDSITVE